MECLFCGMDVEDMPYHKNGEIYCNKECADADTGAEDNLDYVDLDDDSGADNGEDGFENYPL